MKTSFSCLNSNKNNKDKDAVMIIDFFIFFSIQSAKLTNFVLTFCFCYQQLLSPSSLLSSCGVLLPAMLQLQKGLFLRKPHQGQEDHEGKGAQREGTSDLKKERKRKALDHHRNINNYCKVLTITRNNRDFGSSFTFTTFTHLISATTIRASQESLCNLDSDGCNIFSRHGAIL